MATGENKSEKDRIEAKSLIELIVSTKPEAVVENDEDLYARPLAEIEVDEDGLCSLAVHSEQGGLDMGDFLIEIGGVNIIVSRDVDGPGDDYEFNGAEIVYSDGLSVEDVIGAIRDNVVFPPYEAEQYCDTDFDPDDVEESVSVDEGDVYATDDEGNVYCYSDEEDVPEDQTVVDADKAVHMLVEQWAEDGGGDDGMIVESYGPWG